MSVSTFFGTRISTILPPPSVQFNNGANSSAAKLQPATVTVIPVECSSRPQKKATAHHRKTRPKKTQPWDIKRRPTVYAPFPPLPSDFTVVSSGDAGADDGEEQGVESSSSSQSVVAENSDSA